MKRFKHLLIILPEGTPESTLFSWAAIMGKASVADSIDILACENTFLEHFPAEKDENADDFKLHTSEAAEQLLSGLNFNIIHREGNPLREALTMLSSGDYDLVITSIHDSTSRTLAERLARKSPAGVLALPENATLPPSNIITAVDFSNLSSLCIEWAEAFATLSTDIPARKQAIHASDTSVPTRATLTISEDNLREWMNEGVNSQMEAILAKHSSDPSSWHSSVIDSHAPGEDLAERAGRVSGSLVIMGSHGKNAFSSALLGSQTCEAIRRSKSPLLIAKRKNESLGFLRELLGTG